MSMIQRVALIFGVGFIVAALAGFFVTGMSSMDPNPATAPRALGLFPVNVVHNFVHLAFGVWGIAASRSWAGSKNYCMISGVIYLALVVLGLIFPRGLGLIPLGGNDIWLHVALGAPLAYFGFTARATAAAPATSV
ncbi:MAG: DUF4383 domain-containing protein [Gemmatimonadota bacterium]|nr:DUF4383 domain-containing protein [Gemmatimonadota bacterium]